MYTYCWSWHSVQSYQAKDQMPENKDVQRWEREQGITPGEDIRVRGRVEGPEPSVLVGIPAYNEATTVSNVVTEAQRYADEVLVVDDGSEDATGERARTAGATLINHRANRGYGAALRSIFEYASERKVDHLVVLDADGQHTVEDIPALIAAQQRSDAEIVIGSRFKKEHQSEIPVYRWFGITVINSLTNLGLRLGYSFPAVSDTQCGFRAYQRNAIDTIARSPDIGTGMGAGLDILFHAAQENYNIEEVSTAVDYDIEQTSTLNPLTHGLELVKALITAVVREPPVRTRGMIAMSFIVITGTVLGVLHYLRQSRAGVS